MYEECENPQEASDGWIIPCIEMFTVEEISAPKSREGGIKDPTDVGDILSTGRKRAAMLMPIMEGMFCDWAGLKWAGGGAHPIVGCRDTRLAPVKKNADLPEGNYSRGELHHGPDKSVLNNAVGRNLHAICSSCHHRWHSLNDPTYESDRPGAHLQWVPSVPYYEHVFSESATEEDFAASDAYWATPKGSRGEYPIELPPENRLRQPEDSSILNLSDNPFEEPLDPFTENGETE